MFIQFTEYGEQNILHFNLVIENCGILWRLFEYYLINLLTHTSQEQIFIELMNQSIDIYSRETLI